MKTGIKIWLIASISVLLAAGCAARKPKSVTEKAIETSDSPETPAMEMLELQAENEQLKLKLRSLDHKISVLEKDKKVYEEKVLNELKQMDETIALMEQVIAEERQGATQVQVVKTPAVPVQKESIENSRRNTKTGAIDIETPSDSKAIETISFDEKSPENESKPVIKPKPLPIPTKKNVKKPLPRYSDPDLVEPKFPISLKVEMGAKQAYVKAYKAFSRAQYQTAVKLFLSFLRKYPNDTDADNSLYWMGQANWKLNRKSVAENNFRKVLKEYQHGETVRGFKTPDSILMLGRISLNKGNKDKARYYFKTVLERYPQSSSAGKAKRELQSLQIIE